LTRYSRVELIFNFISQLHRELERLEEEKRKNLAHFIKQVREELCDLWVSKCFMTSANARFTEQVYLEVTPFVIADFTSDLYTEELLEKHEKEVEYWRSFVDRNQKIIDVVRTSAYSRACLLWISIVFTANAYIKLVI